MARFTDFPLSLLIAGLGGYTVLYIHPAYRAGSILLKPSIWFLALNMHRLMGWGRVHRPYDTTILPKGGYLNPYTMAFIHYFPSSFMLDLAKTLAMSLPPSQLLSGSSSEHMLHSALSLCTAKKGKKSHTWQ